MAHLKGLEFQCIVRSRGQKRTNKGEARTQRGAEQVDGGRMNKKKSGGRPETDRPVGDSSVEI